MIFPCQQNKEARREFELRFHTARRHFYITGHLGSGVHALKAMNINGFEFLSIVAKQEIITTCFTTDIHNVIQCNIGTYGIDGGTIPYVHLFGSVNPIQHFGPGYSNSDGIRFRLSV